jgi:hypothetical protein
MAVSKLFDCDLLFRAEPVFQLLGRKPTLERARRQLPKSGAVKGAKDRMYWMTRAFSGTSKRARAKRAQSRGFIDHAREKQSRELRQSFPPNRNLT